MNIEQTKCLNTEKDQTEEDVINQIDWNKGVQPPEDNEIYEQEPSEEFKDFESKLMKKGKNNEDEDEEES